MFSYRIAGLSVGSEIALPGAIETLAPPPDVTIRRDDVPEALEDPASFGPTWAMAGDRFLLRIPDVARFLLTAGRDIAFAPEGGTPAEDLAIFLCGTLFGILLHQRGQVVLHASAVRVGGKAVLFCGESGAGKSTLAAALAARGYPLVADDVCAVSIAGAPSVQPEGCRLKLWPQAIDKLDLAARRGAAVRATLQKFHVDTGETFGSPLPVGAMYGLRETRPPLASGIERPNVVDGALLLRRHAYRPLLVRQMDQKAIYFQAAVSVANAAGLFHLTRALDFKQMPEIVASLERHWQDLGLMDRAA